MRMKVFEKAIICRPRVQYSDFRGRTVLSAYEVSGCDYRDWVADGRHH